jgi:hypothetical protein
MGALVALTSAEPMTRANTRCVSGVCAACRRLALARNGAAIRCRSASQTLAQGMSTNRYWRGQGGLTPWINTLRGVWGRDAWEKRRGGVTGLVIPPRQALFPLVKVGNTSREQGPDTAGDTNALRSGSEFAQAGRAKALKVSVNDRLGLGARGAFLRIGERR